LVDIIYAAPWEPHGALDILRAGIKVC
jgi:hypothetical protein